MAIVSSDYSKTKHKGLRIHKDGVSFLFDIRIEGKRFRKIWNSNPVHSKADRLKTAYLALENYRQEAEHSIGITADINATINDYWEILIGRKKQIWSNGWMASNKNFYSRYLKNTIGKKHIKDIRPSDLSQFNKSISHLSPRTQKHAYEILIPIFNLAVEDEVIFRSPVKKTHIPKRKQLEEKKIVTDAVDKYRAIHGAIHEVYKNDPMYRAMFLFGFFGRRKSEVTNLRWEDIDFINNRYLIRADTSKVNIDMTFELPKDVKDALLEFADNSGPVFSVHNIDRQYKKIRKASGIDEFTFHWMRNLSVSALSSMGVEITHLSAMLGHTDSGTIRKYLSLQREASTAVTNEASKRLLS